ncbi:MAG: hypothetical protein RB288_04880 [Bacteroidales bacterium]|jgi:hypothetical protein|nr:hypothetical protein [Bacteroidales bacterium]
MREQKQRGSVIMKTVPFFILIMAVVLPLQGQADYQAFHAGSLKTNNTGMYILGSWAVANMAAGAYLWSTATGNTKYFGQMNLFWNVVNLSIAGFALYGNYTTDFSTMAGDELLARHLKTENLLLINSALDIGYIGAGFLMRHLSDKSVNRGDLLRGYGNSVILQGGFLLVFDLVMYGIMRGQRVDFLRDMGMALTSDNFTVGFHLTF